jgi:hypothetical protein
VTAKLREELMWLYPAGLSTTRKVIVDIKEGKEVRASLDRISYDIESGRAFFTLLHCDDTFSFKASSREQQAALALSRSGDEVCVRVDHLPQEGFVCDVVKFVNCELYVKH